MTKSFGKYKKTLSAASVLCVCVSMLHTLVLNHLLVMPLLVAVMFPLFIYVQLLHHLTPSFTFIPLCSLPPSPPPSLTHFFLLSLTPSFPSPSLTPSLLPTLTSLSHSLPPFFLLSLPSLTPSLPHSLPSSYSHFPPSLTPSLHSSYSYSTPSLPLFYSDSPPLPSSLRGHSTIPHTIITQVLHLPIQSPVQLQARRPPPQCKARPHMPRPIPPPIPVTMATYRASTPPG